MNAKSIVVFIAVLLSAASCISEPLAESGGSTDGTRTPVTLSIRGGRFPGEELAGEQFACGTPLTGRALSEVQETVISQLQLLVFNSKGEAVLNERFKNLTLTDGMYRLQTELLPGNGMQLYVIANADVANLFAENLPVLLNSITRLSELESLIANLQNGNNGLNRTDRLLMTGSATVDVTKPHRNAIPLTLNYLCAKVTVTLTDNTSNPLDIDITGWDMVNIPRKTNLLEQTGRDAVTGTAPNDYLTTASKFPFESGSKQTKTWSQTCYLLENRRGGRVDRADPTNPADKYPGMGVGDSDQRGKAWYAPAGATCLLVYGTHTQNGQVNNIIYKIYLGENAVNDYNLMRGRHYKYNVTINGLNDINVDTNVEWGPASFTLEKSDNLLMDAHPDCRVLRIGGTAVDNATPAYAMVEVMGGVSWLSLSPLNLYRHAVKQMEQPGYEHQQFAANDGIGSFVRTRYSAVTHTAEYQNALFGMTRQLTKIPFTQPAVCTYQDVLVYADNYTGNNDRTAQVCVTYYNGTTVAGQQTLDITQSGAIPVSADLFVERYEESAMKLYPALADELQRTSVMQWGYDTELLYGDNDRFSNGYYLTANAVYSTVAARAGMATPQWTAGSYAAYRAKYPRTGAAVSEPSSMATSGAPYYYPDLQASTLVTSYFHPIYNSSAARYCHEKNRDLDGDGVINANETLWYLPSYADMVAIKKNPPATQPLTGTYWTSTEESADKCWAFTFPGGTAVMADKNTSYRVRCVRGTGAVLSDATIKSTEPDNTKINLVKLAGASGKIEIADETGFTWTVTSDATSWLKIATSPTGTDADDTQTGNANKTLYAYAATANTSNTATRSGLLTLTRVGMSDTPAKAITVTQALETEIRPPAHKGWAGCNIYWEPNFNNSDGTTGRLTFDDVGETTHNNYQGVYFQWGSLVAISPLGTNYNPASTILFSPSGRNDYSWRAIPNGGTADLPTDYTRAYLLEIHNPAADVGDICKYITDRGWAPGAAQGKKWRMAVAVEFDTPSDYTRLPATGIPVSDDANGQTIIEIGRTRGIGANFPASQYRQGSGMIPSSCTTGSYISSSATGTYLLGMCFYDLIEVNTIDYGHRYYSSSVRCVLE